MINVGIHQLMLKLVNEYKKAIFMTIKNNQWIFSITYFNQIKTN